MREEQFDAAENGGTRINKFLALCGIDSRRVADRMIAEGRVEVNGQVIDTPGMKVTAKDFVKVDGRHMTPLEETVVLLNKPRGFVCSREAQGAIGTVYDLLPPKLRHLNYVGRLDADSEGLLIMTNKGELTQKLSHPGGGIEKEYWVTADQHFENSVLVQFLRGVRIPEGNAKAKYVCRASARRAAVVLEQGLKRQVRQMFRQLGLQVRKLVRVRIGSLWGGDLEPGAWRFMTDEDVALVQKNPGRPRKYMSAAQVVKDTSKSTQPARPGKPDSDDDYIFNPNDFEGADVYDPDPFIMSRFTDDDDEINVGDTLRDDSVRGGRGERGGRDRKRDFGGRERREGGFRSERREGGFKRREGGFGGGERRDGGFRGNREGGFRGERREGGFKRREGVFGGGERREGGFRGNREGGFRSERREGGFKRREGGFGGGEHREGGFRGNREGGFRSERREGGFKRREGGFGGGERREGGFRGNREGGFRSERREGGFKRREGGFGGGERRDGGFKRREGGFRKPGFGGRPSGGFRGGKRGH